METLIENIPWIILVTILMYICYRLWKAGKNREPDNEIYEKELRNKCPFDGEHCGIIGRSLTDQYITKTCLKCPRYDNWLKKGLGEQELREKVKKITDD